MDVPQVQMTLDPEDWEEFRSQAHAMVDVVVDHMKSLRSRPVWQPMPKDLAMDILHKDSPFSGESLKTVCSEFQASIQPYTSGNCSPGFFGWVQGGGNPAAVIGELLSTSLNMNCGGRYHAGTIIEQQVASWCKKWFNFPSTAEGLFVTGSSIANFMGVLGAKTSILGEEVRKTGIVTIQARCVVFASATAHGCVKRALEMAGFGYDSIYLIPTDSLHRMDITKLSEAIAEVKSNVAEGDESCHRTPLMVIATAGTVDAGAIDDLDAIADICAREQLWLHVDGAYAALGVLSSHVAPLLKGIERADSIAFDFHKWGQVPYDAGFALFRDGAALKRTFAQPLSYLARDVRGISSSDWWACDYGPDLSRGCRAMKTWFTLKVHGTKKIGAVITGCCELARYLGALITQEHLSSGDLELLSPVQLNIVCFRYLPRGYGVKNSTSADGQSVAFNAWNADAIDKLNKTIVLDLHHEGIVAPSTTIIPVYSSETHAAASRVDAVHKVLAIRVAVVNHRVEAVNIAAVVERVLSHGRGYSSPEMLED